MSTSIYTPYFYIIQHIKSGKYYSGSKYGVNANPDQLLKFNGYHTSSAIIKNIILEEGLESFVVRKIKIFETGEEALSYESRFLRRVNASFNESFLNRSNSSLSTLNVDLEKRKDTCLKKYCVEHVLQSEQIKEKSKQTFLLKYRVEHNSQVPEFQEKKKQTVMNNFNVEYPMQSEIVKETLKQNNLEKYNCENVFQLESVKEKSKQTTLSKYGVEHNSQSPEIKEKKKQIFINFMNQPTILELTKYRDKFKLKLGRGWYYKPQEFLDNLLIELKMTYGEIE